MEKQSHRHGNIINSHAFVRLNYKSHPILSKNEKYISYIVVCFRVRVDLKERVQSNQESSPSDYLGGIYPEKKVIKLRSWLN